jgi:zinc protease
MTARTSAITLAISHAAINTTAIIVAAITLHASAAVALEPTAVDEGFRAARPTPGPAPTFTLPSPIHVAIPGTKVDAWLIERHDLPIVEMSVVFDLGSASDTKGEAGRAGLCVDLFDEGTRRLPKGAWEDAKADIAAAIGADNGLETSRLSLRATKAQLEPALALFAELVASPGLRDDDLERLRSQHRAAVLQARASPSAVAQRVLPAVAWGDGHPYGGVVTEASLDAVTQKDCADLVASLKPDGALLLAVGDITPAELAALWSKHLGTWRGKAPARPRIGKASPRDGTIFLIDVPGAPQSRVLVVQPGPPRDAADYVPTSVMARILAGGFSSRINMNLREKNGYTYGAGGGFDYNRSGSLFTIGSSIRTDATGKALREIAAEMRRMTAEEPTQSELTRERDGALYALPAQFATGSRALSSYASLLFFGLPMDWWQKLPTALAAVDGPTVAQAAKAHVRTTGVRVIVAGDAAQVRADLDALAAEGLFGGGGLVLLDADGTKR